MGYAVYERMFQHVGEWAMPDIMQQDSGFHGFGLWIEDENAFLPQRVDGFTHQVEGTQAMLKTGVLRSWIDHAGQPQLFNAGKALH